eukprot:scaffold809_cov118-Cylindrotheca_fusiformis.AAC.3
MEWLFSRLPMTESQSPMERQRKRTEEEESKDSMRRSSAFTSRITPWISSYLLEELEFPSSANRKHNHRPRMVEILGRGGPFWEYDKHNKNSDEDLDGWLLVTDGQYSIQMMLSSSCRAAIWNQVSAVATRSMYAFLHYSRGHCGLLQDYSLFLGGGGKNSIQASSVKLVCDSFLRQPQLQNTVVTNNTMIQSISQCVPVQHALQSYRPDQGTNKDASNQSPNTLGDPSNTRNTVNENPNTIPLLGNVRDALENEQLMDTILKQAEDNMTREREESIAVATTLNDPNKKNGDDSDDHSNSTSSAGSNLQPMNIHDMLASPPPKRTHNVQRKRLSTVETTEDIMGGLDDADCLQITFPAQSPRKKRKPYRFENDDFPNLPLFAAFCKQLDNDDVEVIEIPGIEQPRCSFENRRMGDWLDELLA